LEVLKVAEENERQAFRSIAKMLNPDPEDFIGVGSGAGDPIGTYEARVKAIEDWIQRGAPAPPQGT
jgi:hypothetical protein